MLTLAKRIVSDKTFMVTLVLSIISLKYGHVNFSDIDFKTIFSLSALLITVSIYQELGILKYVASYIVARCQSTRTVFLVLLLCSFFGSMLFTNDVAILTLIPIFFNIKKHLTSLPSILTVSLLTVYANLGSAITPFGNPQNIYIVSFYNLSLPHFLTMSLGIGVLALITLFMCPLFIKNIAIQTNLTVNIKINHQKVIYLFVASAIVLMGILSIIPISISLVASILSGILLSKKVFKRIDYAIILTFINFFIIISAVSKIDAIRELIHTHTQNQISIFFSAVITSQLISNVPATVLLSKFTTDNYPLFLGVTVGGLGTIIASLANLLALRQYNGYTHNHTSLQFLKKFTLLNIVFLLLFILIGLILLHL
ncbi:anion permease [Leuconostoc litchii]|uniref:Carboxylate transporter n=1 Tax=Leuconostoc litchii TaxID=1981069 RepID=A0A6P2CTK3_9LACO|nr:SLC13 family permease [Leuconostoc litchii]TYC47577.1 carboxylate transporter [Leuconostoc litchii]GMA69615.1 anion permease [Leuconostoc litchii]